MKPRTLPAPDPPAYVPQFAPTQQTVAQRWQAVRDSLGAGGSDGAITSAESVALWLRYVAGELDLQQVEDELLRWYKSAEAPAADVRPLPPLVLGRVYPYAAELAALHAELRRLPPPAPYQPAAVSAQPW